MEGIPAEKLYRSENYVFDDKKVWAKLSWFNDILEIDRENGNARLIPLPDEYIHTPFSFRSINRYGDNLYIIPFRAQKLLVLNMNSEEYEEIDLPYEALENGESAGFIQSVIVGDELILFGYHPRFVIYELNTGLFRIIEGIRDFYSPEFELTSWMAGWAVVNNRLFVHILKTNSLISLDLDSKSLSIVYIGNYDHISGFCGFYDDRFWFDIADDDKPYKLVSSNEYFDDIKEYTLSQIINIGIRPVSWFAVSHGKAFLFPGKLDKGYIYDIEKNKLDESLYIPSLSVTKMEKRSEEVPMNYFGLTQMSDCNVSTKDGRIITIHGWSEQLIDYNIQSNHSNVTKIKLLNESYPRIKYEIAKCRGLQIQRDKTIEESRQCTLSDYVILLSFE